MACSTPAMKDELAGTGGPARWSRARRQAKSSAASPPVPRIHPNLAEVYRQKVARLHEELELGRELRERRPQHAIRSLIEAVRLVPVEGKLPTILSSLPRPGRHPGPRKRTTPKPDGRGLQITLVAGARNHP